MNAIQFIKEHGIEKAREVVEGAPDKTATHYVFRKIPSYYSIEFQSWYHDGEWWDSDCHTEQDLIDSYGSDFVLSLTDLKRLVESVDKVIKLGGINEAKAELNRKSILRWIAPEIQSLKQAIAEKQAIADYEQLFGNTETLGGEHV